MGVSLLLRVQGPAFSLRKPEASGKRLPRAGSPGAFRESANERKWESAYLTSRVCGLYTFWEDHFGGEPKVWTLFGHPFRKLMNRLENRLENHLAATVPFQLWETTGFVYVAFEKMSQSSSTIWQLVLHF